MKLTINEREFFDLITVESGIPVPDFSTARRQVYPWSEMKVGDSFLVNDKPIGTIRSAICARSKKNPGERYTCQAALNGVRVWRIA